MFKRAKGFGVALKSSFHKEAQADSLVAQRDHPLDATLEDFLREDYNKPLEVANPELPVFLFFRH
jgi:hypothetical protein